MSSQLNVDTIVDKAGSGGTNVNIANTSVTVAEGGSATTNTVQGLCKAWLTGGNDASVDTADSLNIASGTDNGTGDYTYTFTSALSNSVFSASGSANTSSDRNVTVNDTATTSYSVEIHQQNGSNINSGNRSMIMGDLA